MFCSFFLFFCINENHLLDPCKISDCKTQVTVVKYSNLRMFFPLIDTVIYTYIYTYVVLYMYVYIYIYIIYIYTLIYSYRLTDLRGWNGNSDWRFYKNMKEAFHEGLPYISHLVFLYTFLTRPHIFLTFIKHLTLINSNLIKDTIKSHFC